MSSFDYFYYPYINFRSETWLKKMALYADSVTRIVPHEYPVKASPTTDFLEQENFIFSVEPDEAGNEPGKVFSDFLLTNQERLRPRFAVDRSAEWRSDLDDAHVRDEISTDRAYVEASKLDGADLEQMEATELIVRSREMDMNWIGMHPLLANAFMTLLMNRLLAQQPNAIPVADFGSNVVDVHIDSKEDLAHALLGETPTVEDADPLRDAFVAFAFEQVLPTDIDTLPIDRIWELRKKFAGEFGQFQQAVAAFCEENRHLEDIANPERMRGDLAKKYRLQVEPTLRDLEKALDGVKIKTMIGSVAITCTAPGVLAGLAKLGLVFNPITAAIAGGALAVAGILHEREAQRSAAFKACDYSWLYRIEHKLPKSTIGELSARASVLWPAPG